MEQAIKKAIEGGWKPEWTTPIEAQVKSAQFYYKWQEIVLDPLFWQALGRAMGRTKVCDDCGQGYSAPRDNCTCGMTHPPLVVWYEYAMHRFIDHLIAGHDADSFFTQLLK